MSDVGAENHAAYSRADVVGVYDDEVDLQPAERTILATLTDELRDARLLDVGIGSGRTTAHLARLVREYVGVDYVPELVDRARARFPDARLEVADARDLGRFSDSSFDFVLFSFNGIDYVSHDDRLAILAEVRRVLVPGGRFLFSTHNRDHARFGLLPWQGVPILNRRTARAVLVAALLAGRRRRLRRQEVLTDTYAIVNDNAHRYRLLTYYISVDDQVRQLEAAGFTDVVAHDGGGHPGEHDSVALWLYYLARA